MWMKNRVTHQHDDLQKKITEKKTGVWQRKLGSHQAK
jgi:hypothetical protein